MIERQIDIIEVLAQSKPPELAEHFDAVAIPTNGSVRVDGNGIAKKGSAGKAAEIWINFEHLLGVHLAKNGNVPGLLGYLRCLDKTLYETDNPEHLIWGSDPIRTHVWSFPTKNDWRDYSSLDLIKASAQAMVQHANSFHYEEIGIPKPGCGAGKLTWNQVKPVLQDILDDRFTILDRPASHLWSP